MIAASTLAVVAGVTHLPAFTAQSVSLTARVTETFTATPSPTPAGETQTPFPTPTPSPTPLPTPTSTPAGCSGGYDAHLESPVVPDSASAYTWIVDGEKAGPGCEISFVLGSGCWDRADIDYVTANIGVVEVKDDGSVKVEGIQDDDLPLTITVYFTATLTSADDAASIFIKTGGGPDAGYTLTVDGPSCEKTPTPAPTPTPTATPTPEPAVTSSPTPTPLATPGPSPCPSLDALGTALLHWHSPKPTATPSPSPAPTPACLPPGCEGPFDHVITGTSAGEELAGTEGRDLIMGNGGHDSIRGLGGADCIVAGAGNDLIDGGGGADVVYAGDGNNLVRGRRGDDVIEAGTGDDVIDGGPGHDICMAGTGSNSVSNCEE